MAPSDPYRRLVSPPRRSAGLSAGAIALAAALACAFGIGVVAAAMLWRADPHVSSAVAAATGRIAAPGSPSAPVGESDDRSWSDEDISACRSEAKQAADRATVRRLAAVSANRVGLGAPDAAIVENATFLLCSVTRKRLHLCAPYWRAGFMEAIKAHAAQFREVANSAYWTKVNIAENARRRAGDGASWQTITDDLDQTTREVAALHEKIVAAFRGLVADGIVDGDEFGVFLGLGIPPDIGAMIGSAEAGRQLCG